MFKCLCCKKEMPHALYIGMKVENSADIQPSGGLHCRTFGHYGSTIFDPLGTGETLEFVICDECMETSIKAGLVYRGKQIAYNDWSVELNESLGDV